MSCLSNATMTEVMSPSTGCYSVKCTHDVLKVKQVKYCSLVLQPKISNTGFCTSLYWDAANIVQYPYMAATNSHHLSQSPAGPYLMLWLCCMLLISTSTVLSKLSAVHSSFHQAPITWLFQQQFLCCLHLDATRKVPYGPLHSLVWWVKEIYRHLHCYPCLS